MLQAPSLSETEKNSWTGRKSIAVDVSSTILFFWKVSNSKSARPAIPDGRCRFPKHSRGVARMGCRFLSQPFVEWIFVISPHFGRFFSVRAVFLRNLWSAGFHSTN